MSDSDVLKNPMLVEYPIVIEFTYENLTSILNHFQKIKLLATAAKNGDSKAQRELHALYFQGDGMVEW